MDFDIIRSSAENIISKMKDVPIAYDNVSFDSTAQDSWARITILDGDSFNNALGGKCVMMTGIIVIQLFAKQWTGSAGSRDLAKSISLLFTNITDNNVVYGVPSINRVGHELDFYQLNINIPFKFNEVLT